MNLGTRFLVTAALLVRAAFAFSHPALSMGSFYWADCANYKVKIEQLFAAAGDRECQDKLRAKNPLHWDPEKAVAWCQGATEAQRKIELEKRQTEANVCHVCNIHSKDVARFTERVQKLSCGPSLPMTDLWNGDQQFNFNWCINQSIAFQDQQNATYLSELEKLEANSGNTNSDSPSFLFSLFFGGYTGLTRELALQYTGGKMRESWKAREQELKPCEDCVRQRKTIEEQLKTAQQNGCLDVLRSPRWNANPQAAFDLCVGGAGTSAAEKETAERAAEIDQCNFCNSYEFATSQLVETAQYRGCLPALQAQNAGLWSPGRANFAACMRTNSETSQGLTMQRSKLLEGCKPGVTVPGLPTNPGTTHLIPVSIIERGSGASAAAPPPPPQGPPPVYVNPQNGRASSSPVNVAPYGGMNPSVQGVPYNSGLRPLGPQNGGATTFYVPQGRNTQGNFNNSGQQPRGGVNPVLPGNNIPKSTSRSPGDGTNVTTSGQVVRGGINNADPGVSVVKPKVSGPSVVTPVRRVGKKMPDKRINYGACSNCKPSTQGSYPLR